MLEVRNLNAWYGRSHVLQGVDLAVAEGEAVCIIGRNGAGKTTTLRTIMGLVPRRRGEVLFAGEDILPQPTHRRFALGLAFVPEERRIVPGLTVQENLRLGLVASANREREAETIDRVTETFPRLRERLDQAADTLSGGEQQMLAIARAMVSDPRLIMLDEPSIGLAPRIVDQVFAVVRRLAEAGKAILMVEQNVKKALNASDRACVLELGRIRLQDRAQVLIGDERVARLYMGMSGAE